MCDEIILTELISLHRLIYSYKALKNMYDEIILTELIS